MTIEAEKQSVDVVGTKEYREGYAAFAEGLVTADNPYPHAGESGIGGLNDQRYRWYVGWYDARTAKVLVKYGT